MRNKNYSRWLDTKHCIWKSAEDDYWLAPATKSFFFQYQDTKFISKRTHFWNANLRRNVLMYLINCVQVVAKPFQTQTAACTKKCTRNEMTRERKWMSIENEDETENICKGSNRAANEALANLKWDRCMRSIIRKKNLIIFMRRPLVSLSHWLIASMLTFTIMTNQWTNFPKQLFAFAPIIKQLTQKSLFFGILNLKFIKLSVVGM